MSAPTLVPGPARTAPAPPRGRAWRGGDARWVATALTAVATTLSAFAISPALSGGWWVVPTALMVAVVAAAGGLARLLRVPAPLQPVIAAMALVCGLTFMFARDEAIGGVLPGPAALRLLGVLARSGRTFIEESVPPAQEHLGLLLLIAGGIGLTALVVDTLAVGLDLPGLTLLPLSALFFVPWVVGHGSAPVWTFLLVALGWLLILGVAQRDWARSWAPTARTGRIGVGAAAAAAACVLALLGGSLTEGRSPLVVLGPGAFGIGGFSDSGPLRVDELVSLRRSLVSNDDREVLTYTTTAERADYLRLAVLDSFDGERWMPRRLLQLSETAPAPTPAWGTVAEYDLAVGPLAGRVVPSPTGTMDVAGAAVIWNEVSSLPVRSDGASVQNRDVSLTVVPPTWTPDQLRTASLEPAEPVTFERIPGLAPSEDPVDPRVAAMAEQVVGGAETPYDQAMALQDWFTEPGRFTYSTSVASGSGEDALSAFLTERVGYCEQFAATMALMARSVGIPARVVTGFTQGSQDASGTWVVRATDAHAWPELWMGTAGWVRFEPTPSSTTSSSLPVWASPESSAGQGGAVPDPASTADAAPSAAADPGRLTAADDGTAGGAAQGTSSLLRPALLTLAVILLLAAPWLARAVVRRRRRGGDAQAAYAELVDTAEDLGLLSGPEFTPRTTVTGLAEKLGIPSEVLDRALRGEPVGDDRAAALARICRGVEFARYAPTPAQPAVVGGRGASALGGSELGGTGLDAGDLDAQLRLLREVMGLRAGRPARLRATLLPRSLGRLAGRISRGGESRQ